MGTSGTGFFDNDDSGDWFDGVRADIMDAIHLFLNEPEMHYQDGIAALNVLVNLSNQDMPIPIPLWNFVSFNHMLDDVIVSLNEHQAQIHEMGWREADYEIKYQKNIQNLLKEVERLKIQLDDWESERLARQPVTKRRRRRKRTN